MSANVKLRGESAVKISPMLRVVCFSTILLSLACSSFVYAFEARLGGGLTFETNIRAEQRDDDLNGSLLVDPFPVIEFSYRNISFFSGVLLYHVYETDEIWLDLIAFYDGHEFENETVRKRHDGLFSGVMLGWGPLEFAVVHDVQNRSRGLMAQMSYSYGQVLSERLEAMVTFELEYLDKAYVDYYFSVKTSESTAQLNAYTGSVALNPGIEFAVSYNLIKALYLESALLVKQHGSEIGRSPTVEHKTLYSLSVQLVWDFY